MRYHLIHPVYLTANFGASARSLESFNPDDLHDLIRSLRTGYQNDKPLTVRYRGPEFSDFEVIDGLRRLACLRHIIATYWHLPIPAVPCIVVNEDELG